LIEARRTRLDDVSGLRRFLVGVLQPVRDGFKD
jgi:hypothetical protein